MDDFDPERSELDGDVEFAELSPRDHALAWFGLIHDLEELFVRSVDVIEVAAIRNPYRRKIIEDQQTTLHDAA